MYQVANSQTVASGGRALLRRSVTTRVSRTVLLLGITSMLTDISSEMVTAVLPIYLVYTLGMSPLQFGVVDGIQQGASALVRVLGGVAADRLGRYKEVASLGYGLSAFSRLLLLVVGRSWSLIGATIFLDRTGKGIRTGPRDALISLSTPQEELGVAFGVHRALDTAGAMLGPLFAFAILLAAPHAFHSVFALSLAFAVVGLAVIVLFVENRPDRLDDAAPAPLRKVDVAGLLAIGRFRTLIAIGFLLAVATTSDGFIYLNLQNKLDFATRNLPLLYVATSLVYMILAIPLGRLADRVGRQVVFVGGYALLLVVYVALIVPSVGVGESVVVIAALGAFYAATDGVLMAFASGLLPPEQRATGLSLLVTATSLGRLLASIVFGAAWSLLGAHAALVVFALALTGVLVVAATVLGRQIPDAQA
jgi:MFS family permease